MVCSRWYTSLSELHHCVISCLIALIALQFVFVIVSCDWLLRLATLASLANQLEYKQHNFTLCCTHSKTMQCTMHTSV